MTEPRVAQDPEAVTVTETGVGRFQVEVLAGNVTVLADEPVAAGGLGTGPTPYDLLSAALGACTVMTLRLYATRKDWPLTRATVRVLHARQGLEGADRFAREVTLEGPLTPEQRRRLLEIADRCPVHRTLEHGSQVLTVPAQPPPLELSPAAASAHMRDMMEACED